MTDVSKERAIGYFLVKIEIDNKELELIRDLLKITGVTESIIYPELIG